MPFHFNGYTNMHDLNLDWVTSMIKSIENAETDTAESAAAAAESATNAAESAQNAEAQAGNAAASAQNAEAQALNAAESAAAISGKAEQIDVNTARLDNLIVDGTPTEGNTELLDIRVDAHGYTYPTAGDAVRGQFTEAEHNLINYRLGHIDLVTGTFNPDGITPGSASVSRVRSKYTQILEDIYVMKVPTNYQGYFYYLDSNNVVLNTPAWTTQDQKQSMFPAGAVKFNVTFRKTGATSEDISGEIETIYNNFKIVYLQNDVAEEYIKKAVAGSNKLINSESLLVAPYDNLNTLPMNEIVSYSLRDAFPDNTPDNFEDISGFTVVSLSRSDDRTYKSVTIQLLVGRISAEQSAMFYRLSWGVDPTAETAWSTWTQLNRNATNQPVIDLSMFGRIAVIGDSFASGISDDIEGGNYYYSWLQMICRKSGCIGANFARGGLTTRTWLTSPYGLSKMNSDTNNYNLYFIALGINDSNPDSRFVPVGNLSDFTTTENTPDTFYGNMGRIYRAVKNKDPNAAVCFITPQRNGERYEPYQIAVAEMAESVGCLLIKSENASLYKTRFWLNNLKTNHPTVPLYNAMANCIIEEFGNAVIRNITYLRNYPTNVN